MKQLLVFILLTFQLFGWSRLYFLPKEGYQAQNKVAYLFSVAHKDIKIAIYAFTNKTFLKAIKKSAKKGVKVKIIADYKSNKDQSYHSIVPILRKLKNIDIKYLTGVGHGKYKGIMHIKMFIIDDKIAGFGSANYTYSAFHNNYEILYITDNPKIVNRLIGIFNELNQKAHRKKVRWF
jgi:phosphatidylserine/phosphatidylglycerophosphate/cardiolipin synthase-like enzyme